MANVFFPLFLCTPPTMLNKSIIVNDIDTHLLFQPFTLSMVPVTHECAPCVSKLARLTSKNVIR